MLPPKDVPLPKEVESEIRRAVADVTDPAIRAEFEKRLRAQRQNQENELALDRRTFRDALEQARQAGHPNPEQIAHINAATAKVVAMHEKRVAAIFRRTKHRSVSIANRAAKTRASAAKTARPNQRRSQERDRKYVDIIGSAQKDGSLDDGLLVASTINRALGSYRPPHWDKSTTAIKVLAMSIEIARRGAWTINLRLSPEVCRAALTSAKGPASVVQHRIREALKQEFMGVAPEFWFTIERDNAQRFHVHGAVVWSGDEDEARQIESALKSGGGQWTGKGGIHQQQGRRLDDPIWWAAYCIKRMNLTALGIDRKLFGSTAEIRDAARGAWAPLRDTLPSTMRSPRVGAT